MPTIDKPKRYTTPQAAKFLGVSNNTVINMADRGDLHPSRNGDKGVRLFRENELIRVKRRIEKGLIKMRRRLNAEAMAKLVTYEEAALLLIANKIRIGDARRLASTVIALCRQLKEHQRPKLRKVSKT